MCKICNGALKEYGIIEEDVHLSPKSIIALRKHEHSLAFILEGELQAMRQQEENRRLIKSFKVQANGFRITTKWYEESQERAKYPHRLLNTDQGLICESCGQSDGIFSRLEGKPCEERYRMRMTPASAVGNLKLDEEPGWTVTKDAAGGKWYVRNDKTPPAGKLINIGTIDVVLHLIENSEGTKVIKFRTLDGNLLPSGTYHARIVDVKVTKP
jgi:hypothetical protein